MINKRALEKAINDSMREEFALKMREFLCYGAPKEITDLYKRYVDECIAADKRKAALLQRLKVASICIVAALTTFAIVLILTGRP